MIALAEHTGVTMAPRLLEVPGSIPTPTEALQRAADLNAAEIAIIGGKN